jgi:hypothetical protein
MMMRIHVNAILTMLLLSVGVPTAAQGGDHSFSCATAGEPFGQIYDLFEDGTLEARGIDEKGQRVAEGKMVKYKTLRKIIINEKLSTCVTKGGQKYTSSYSDTYLIELETKEPGQEAALMFLCEDGGGGTNDDCTRETTKTKALHPTYRYSVKKRVFR